MRPQNRPFVVEIKKTKRPGAPATAGASAAQPPATWAEQFEQATALTESAARKAAEALFAPPRPTAPAPQQPARVEDTPADPWRTEAAAPAPSSQEAPGRKGRILVAIGSEPAPAVAAAAEGSAGGGDVDGSSVDLPSPAKRQPDMPQAERPPVVRPASRPGRPRKAAAETPSSRPAAKTRKEPVPAQRLPAAAVIATPVRTEDTVSPGTPSVPARKGIWRRGGEPLGRGEKWKRRLPQALR